jgi:hypothetical protein
MLRRLGKSVILGIAMAAAARVLATAINPAALKARAASSHVSQASALTFTFLILALVFSALVFFVASFVAWHRTQAGLRGRTRPAVRTEEDELGRSVGSRPARRYRDRSYEDGNGWW